MVTDEAANRLAPLRFTPMDEASAREILNWRYEAPYEVYNLNLEDTDQVIGAFTNPEFAYRAIVDRAGELVGYCCFGLDAQVPGGDYDNPALDVGLGVRPDLTGRGLGAAFVSAVLRVARDELAPTEFRVTVAEFNERALRVWQKFGFQPVQRFERTFDGMPFVILAREAARSSPREPGDAGSPGSNQRQRVSEMEANLLEPIRHQINCGDRQGAKAALAELLEQVPDNADAWALLAILLTEPAEQAQCYREILRIKPDDRQAALWLESLTSQISVGRAQTPRGRECPRCGEMVRASPLPGSPRQAIVCPSCGFPVPLTDAPVDGERRHDDREPSDAVEAEMKWIPNGIDLEQLLQQVNVSGAAGESRPPTRDTESEPGLAGRQTLLSQLLGRLRGTSAEDEAGDLVTNSFGAVSATGAITPELILSLAGGPLAPEQRRDCPACGAVVSRTEERCPWCSAPLPDVHDQ